MSIPSDLGRHVLLPWLDEFQQRHPRVNFQVRISDRLADLYRQPVDIALRYGTPGDSGLVALPLGEHNRRVVCAAPAYFARHGMPRTPPTCAAITACASCWASPCTTAGPSSTRATR